MDKQDSSTEQHGAEQREFLSFVKSCSGGKFATLTTLQMGAEQLSLKVKACLYRVHPPLHNE